MLSRAPTSAVASVEKSCMAIVLGWRWPSDRYRPARNAVGLIGRGGSAMADLGAGRSLVRARGEGERRWFFGGGIHTWKATAEETNGAFLLFEDRMAHGKVTPLHTQAAS